MAKYYKKAMDNVISSFEATHKKLLKTMEDGREPTPADLYKLDKYWQMQGQLKKELELLGNKEIEALSKTFTNAYKDVYDNLAIQGGAMFAEVDKKAAEQVMQQIWCADGKTWSQRIWTNTDKLQQMLNDQLLDCVITGKKTTELKNLLQERFQVSYSAADSLVRTEIAHIQTQAARDRYIDAGVAEVEVWADKDERRCDVCGKLHEKRFKVTEKIPVPAHPRCRCTIIPVVEPDNQLVVRDDRNQLVPADQVNPLRVNKPLTTKKKDVRITLTEVQQKAQEKVDELKKHGELEFYQHTERHQSHAEKITGLVGNKAWEKYEKEASDFIKKDIDGANVDGFISKQGWLFKFEKTTGYFAILSDRNTISTYFIPDKKTPEEYWKDQIQRYYIEE